MADAGPSNSASSSRNAVTTPPSSASRASHIHFPQDYDPGSAGSSKKSSMSQQQASLGIGRPPIARRATSRSSTHGERSNGRAQLQPDDVRPRVKSVDAPMSSPSSSRPRLGGDLTSNPTRKATPPAHRLAAARRARARGDADMDGEASYTTKTFSDEYDLDDEKAEKRWRTLSIKRKPREKPGIPSNKDVVEKQDTLYTDKLAQIKAKVQPLTFRKAAITRDQLERRYGALLGNASPRPGPSNILGAARWYEAQDASTKASLDKSEPLTWLKHLDKSRRQPTTRLPWHITALILEEYLRIKHRHDTMETIPENGVVDTLALRPSPRSLPESGDKSPSSGSWSWTPPTTNSIGPSLSRRKVSHDGQISFEPVVDSGRESIGDESRFADNPLSNWIHSRTGGTASPRNSTQSSLFYPSWGQGQSPNNSRLNFKDFAQRIRRKPYGSDDGLSSARNSLSEHSADDDRPRSRTRARKRPRNSSLQIVSRSAPATDDEKPSREPSEGAAPHHSDGEVPSTAKPELSAQSSPAAQKASASRQPSPLPRIAAPRPVGKRASLPSYNQFMIRQAEQRRQEADEERERHEYERKIQMLEDTMAQNHSTRQILQRVSHHMKEYDNVQNTLSNLMGVSQLKLPQDVLEAFNHDPSAVIGSTKRYKGWRAVEDIHDRIVRQRQTIHTFVASISEGTLQEPIKNVFEDPIESLLKSLDQLDGHRESLAREADSVAEALQRVKVVHSSVKRDYNETLSHTSLIYPELSQIITLEENYRNHYQQLWNIGLDALTLLLDTVTPFWRIYGKVIGEDVQDFLIVPWYRNEFTGEPNWYPIKNFPKRSIRHWVGLLLFSVTSVMMTLLQIRAACSFSSILNLPWLADVGVRWLISPLFAVALIAQWCAVLFESFLIFAQAGILVWWLGWSVRVFV
ncbi:hypothetical protein EIP91_011528 [Steccherinum ochraceum]|uniref:Uncharacterized protein n=1 Tax=Steccherinum ochraceum TaxID=92696 RepID=A0A4R0RKK5_9APHY|nr:hypothetical protein EIP91_011528 [Steccherinum ochraceum]